MKFFAEKDITNVNKYKSCISETDFDSLALEH